LKDKRNPTIQNQFGIYLFNYINLFFPLSTPTSPLFVINQFSYSKQYTTYDDQPKHNEKKEACTAAELDIIMEKQI
jgi:hypothetical protein